MKLLNVPLAACVALFGFNPMSAMADDSINPPTIPQTAPMNAQEAKNLQMVKDWLRVIFAGHHSELASEYMAQDYIQHNPNIDTGLAGFVEFAKALGPPVNPMPQKLALDPVVAGAKGDYVWYVFEFKDKQLHGPEKKNSYTNGLGILRVQNGKIQEHWDVNKRNPKSKVVRYGISPKPPMQWNTGTLSKEEEGTLAVTTKVMKDILQYGHIELADAIVAPDYIEHDPNGQQGRDGFKTFWGPQLAHAPEPVKAQWKQAPAITLVNGPYAIMMWDRTDKDPTDPRKDYSWSQFELVRVNKGMIAEHWDQASANPQADDQMR